MTNTIQELFNRKSIRVYTDREISAEKREAILLSAMNAPTEGNQQLYTIIDIQDQDLKNRMAIVCDNQPFIATGKLVLVFCADCKKWYEAFGYAGADPKLPGVGDLMIAVSDANIAAQNAVVAAESLGIGSCYIGDVMENCEQIRECLELPKYVFPAAMLVFGYPTEQQKNRIKPERHKLSDIVCIDEYKEKNEAELKAMFSKNCENKGYEEWMKAFCTRKYNSDFCVEMTRSVAEYLKDFER